MPLREPGPAPAPAPPWARCDPSAGREGWWRVPLGVKGAVPTRPPAAAPALMAMSRTQQAVLCALSLVPGSAPAAVIVGHLMLVRGPLIL